jgi:hypothetical protein
MHLSAIAAALAALLLTVCNAAAAGTVDALDAADPMTWLVKSVCTDATDRPIVADPYYGCPPGYGIRKIQSGDPLSYHNIEQAGYQQRDAFPVFDPIDGINRVIATFDYMPFNTFNLFNGTDGYDVYTVQNGWANITNTSDGGGYGQTFYANSPVACTVGGGWVLFPASGFLNGGQATVPLRGIYWEQSDGNYPGLCPTSYAAPQTSWSYRTGFKFGGVNGNPVKRMNTVISNHGFSTSPSFLQSGHLEVFYFTREYGITRWEVWTPLQQHPTRTSECIVPRTIKYQGVSFVVQDCHDWSVYEPATAAAIPLWPIPNINVLKEENNPHFVGVGGVTPPGWIAVGVAAASAVSTSYRDTGGNTRAGVAYLQLACADATSCCGFTNALYQELPAPPPGSYAFAISARAEGAGNSGAIAVAVEQRDSSGNVVQSDATTAVVQNDNGTQPGSGEGDSVYLSSAFVGKRMTIAAGIATVRILISPQTPQITFDVLDAWLAPYPAAAP